MPTEEPVVPVSASSYKTVMKLKAAHILHEIGFLMNGEFQSDDIDNCSELAGELQRTMEELLDVICFELDGSSLDQLLDEMLQALPGAERVSLDVRTGALDQGDCINQ